jgi:hypothetical protein
MRHELVRAHARPLECPQPCRRQCLEDARGRRGRHWRRGSVWACGAGRRGILRADGRVGRVGVGTCAGAESAESDGEEEAAGAEPDGAQVPT